MAVKRGLGKGLDALFFDNSTKLEENAPVTIRLNEIEPNRNQPRKQFDAEALETLADSIRQNGLLQPLLVRPLPSGGYQLVAGERRWRACRMAGLSEVPVLVRDIDDAKSMELALIENLQRENLNPIEEAQGYQELMERYQLSQEEVSKSVGKSRSAVANTLRLLSLPVPVQNHLQKGELSAGHGRALIGLDAALQSALAQRAIKEGLSVREMEALAKEPVPKRATVSAPKRDRYYEELELAFKQEMNRRVKVVATGKKKELRIEFYDNADLSDIVRRLTEGKYTLDSSASAEGEPKA